MSFFQNERWKQKCLLMKQSSLNNSSYKLSPNMHSMLTNKLDIYWRLNAKTFFFSSKNISFYFFYFLACQFYYYVSYMSVRPDSNWITTRFLLLQSYYFVYMAYAKNNKIALYSLDCTTVMEKERTGWTWIPNKILTIEITLLMRLTLQDWKLEKKTI